MNPFKEAFRILALLTIILLIGVFGYHVIEGWSLFDALYMTVITLATVGYGETHPLSISGRVFTMFLIMGGMGIILYGVTEITAFLVEGEMTGVLRRRTMNRAIGKISGHYILCGWGNTGHYVLEELIRTRRRCVIVEKDPERVKKLAEMKMLVIQGDATEDSVLKSAGIERATGLVAALTSDRDNLFIVITARGLNPKLRIISKIEAVNSQQKFLRSGADSAVSAQYIGGLRMASELVRPNTVNFLDSMLRDNSHLRVEDVQVGSDSKFTGKTLGSCDILSKAGVVLLSLRQNEAFQFNPPSNTVLKGGDTLVMMGTPEQIKSVRAALS